MSADDTSGEVDERFVGEVHSLFLTVEVFPLAGIVRIGWESSTIGEDMSALRHLDEVVADGHADGVLAILVGFHDFAILRTDGAVDIEGDILYGIVGAGIAYLAADGERRDILEVDTAMYER